ncbi:hypothetical protein IWX90DRAFT_206211 [Phyllosticta citrichinensis]|uniref:Secreted protein n=1 Tax=Phyllosticta citrichinensis TaxID=1130410 RepID=A0ABR1XT14_9PEZI
MAVVQMRRVSGRRVQGSKGARQPDGPVSALPSAVCCLLSAVCCLLSASSLVGRDAPASREHSFGAADDLKLKRARCPVAPRAKGGRCVSSTSTARPTSFISTPDTHSAADTKQVDGRHAPTSVCRPVLSPGGSARRPQGADPSQSHKLDTTPASRSTALAA